MRLLLRTSRGRTLLASQFLIAFGLISAIVQFAGQVFGLRFAYPGLMTGVSLAICIIWAFVRSYPRSRAMREFTHPDLTIVIRIGDIFNEEADLVVGFSDTFDTDTTDNYIINESSLQGQLLRQTYGEDRCRLDRELDKALSGVEPLETETRATKLKGKLRRYPIGTIAVIGSPQQKIYCVAYSRLNNELTAQSSMNDLWVSFGQLWKVIGQRGQLSKVAIPVMGAELARVHSLDRENLLKVIILSFIAHSRTQPICRKLTVVIRPEDAEKVDLLEMQAFLAAL
ncbi:macro domain-containing protein [Streptosporangium sp. DT93]|uniref:macro domain-containing protein n=1 Tax=Streptosporangium sp. DT93 TaxID=3393428 RepID=UPI003CFAD294